MIDLGEEDGDWIKSLEGGDWPWPGIDNAEDLRLMLEQQDVDWVGFTQTQFYIAWSERLPWLKNLIPELENEHVHTSN